MDFKALPKIELHAHLTGSISRQTLHEIWRKKKDVSETDLEDPLVVMPEGKHDFNLQTFFPLFTSYIYKLLQDAPSIHHATTSVLKSFLDDGVVYLELRTTPRQTGHLSPEALIATIISAIHDFENAPYQPSPSQSSSHASSKPTTTGLKNKDIMHTRLILSIDRSHSLQTAHSILSLTHHHQPTTVALDLCGNPSTLPHGQISLFTPVFQLAAAQNIPCTVHFAETQSSASRQEMEEVLLRWKPKRLGHVIWEDDWARGLIVKEGLCLELCVSCNVEAGMVEGSFGGHHFGMWRGVEGVKLSLGTDDVGVFGSPLSNEYRLVMKHFGLDRSEICALARDGIEAIFGGEEEKQRLREIMWT